MIKDGLNNQASRSMHHYFQVFSEKVLGFHEKSCVFLEVHVNLEKSVSLKVDACHVVALLQKTFRFSSSL